MKYCQKCGNELNDDAMFCPKCGTACSQTNINNLSQNNADEKPIKGALFGVLLALFTGPIGLIICIFLGDEQAKKGAIITFVAALIVSIFIFFIFILFNFLLIPKFI